MCTLSNNNYDKYCVNSIIFSKRNKLWAKETLLWSNKLKKTLPQRTEKRGAKKLNFFKRNEKRERKISARCEGIYAIINFPMFMLCLCLYAKLCSFRKKQYMKHKGRKGSVKLLHINDILSLTPFRSLFFLLVTFLHNAEFSVFHCRSEIAGNLCRKL